MYRIRYNLQQILLNIILLRDVGVYMYKRKFKAFLC